MSGAQLIAAYKKSSTANFKKLQELAEGPLESQQLLIRTAEQYQEQKCKIEATGSSMLAESKVKKRRPGKTAEAEGSIALPKLVVPEGVELRRGLKIFKGWDNKLALELLQYLDATAAANMQNFSKDELHKVIEYILDVRLFGPTLDRIGNTDKKCLFESLEQVYKSNGKRLEGLEIQPHNAGVDWAKSGHFAIEVRDGNAVRVFCKLLNQVVVIPQDLIGDDPGPFTTPVGHNFSRYSATLDTKKESYKLNMFFPRLARSLLRRPSDVVGATGAAVAAVEADSTSPQTAGLAVEAHEDAPPSPANIT